MKVIVFDLDSTLCAIGKEILPETVEMLKALEDKGNRICISSGKPTYYLVGMFRQVGLKSPIFIGENGGVIQFGVDLPPAEYYVTTHLKTVVRKLKELRQDLEEEFGKKIWFQPNEIELTAFPQNQDDFDKIESFIKSKNIEDIIIYRQVDCFDVVPCDVSKRRGLEYLADLLGLGREDFIALGDGINDYPMFDYAGISLGINLKDVAKAHHNYNHINKALESLIEML